MGSQKPSILIGIDLGFSIGSAAFLLPGKNAQPTPVTVWPGADDVKSPLIPCCINPHLPTENNWGYFVESEGADALLLKYGEGQQSNGGDSKILSLLRHREGSRNHRKNQPDDRGRSIKKFMAVAQKHIETRISLTFGKDILSNGQCQWCFTVPPWWDATTEAAFVSLVHDTGMKDVHVISQPTAILTSFVRQQKNHPWRSGDRIFCYHIETMITTASALIVDEVTPNVLCKGRGCKVFTVGSNDLLQNLINLVTERVQNHLRLDQYDQEDVKSGFAKLQLYFQKTLPKLDGTKDFKFRLPWTCPDDSKIGVIGSEMTIEAHILRFDIFRPFFSIFHNMILEHQPAPLRKTYILFSGVLSECPYILKYVEELISDEGYEQRITIVRPVNGSTMASRGAALNLDENRKTASVTPLPWCPLLDVTSPLPSSMFLLDEKEEKLKRTTGRNPISFVEAEDLIRAYNTILRRRIDLSGLESSTINTFTSLLNIYKKQNKPTDIARLRASFEAVFREEHMTQTSDPLPSELLFLVARSGTPEMLHFVIETGPSLQTACMDGPEKFKHHTALHFAICSANLPAIEWLCQNGADPCAKTAAGQTSIHLAIAEHSHSLALVKIIKLFTTVTMVDKFRVACDMRDDFGMTALDRAKEVGLGDIASILEANTTKVNTIRPLGSDSVQVTIDRFKSAPQVNGTTTKQKQKVSWRQTFKLKKTGGTSSTNLNPTPASLSSHMENGDAPKRPGQQGVKSAPLVPQPIQASTIPAKKDELLREREGPPDDHDEEAFQLKLAVMKSRLKQKRDQKQAKDEAPKNTALEPDINQLPRPSERAQNVIPASDAEAILKLRALGYFYEAGESFDKVKALREAAAADNILVTTYLLENFGASMEIWKMHSVLVDAIRRGNEKIVAIFFAETVQPNQTQWSSHFEDLMTVIAQTQTQSAFFATLLINLKPDMLEREVLCLAIIHHNDLLFSWALKKTSTIEKIGWRGLTPLGHAIRAGNLNAAKILMDNGASPNPAEGGKLPPLHIAAQGGRTDMIELLLGRGADINAVVGYDRETALHRAVVKGNGDAIRILIQRGANPYLKNRAKRSPLNLARNSWDPTALQNLNKLIQEYSKNKYHYQETK